LADDEDSVDTYVDRLRGLINIDSLRHLQRDPGALEGGLRRALVDLQRMVDLAKENAQLQRSRPAVREDDHVTGLLVSEPISVPTYFGSGQHLNMHQISGVREAAILLEIETRNGSATLKMLRQVVDGLWKGDQADKNDAALRQQLSRLTAEELITSVTNGNYRITDKGRAYLIKSAKLRIGLIQEARPELIEPLQALPGWDGSTASHSH
jgi:DNA-binding PadR family transcriptional regulator